MRCPYCQVDNDRVQDTRNADGGYLIRRRRICNSCQRRFVTAETIEKLNVRVVKSDQTREPFDREKIRRGIERACSKRPISSSTIESVVQAIESDIYATYESEVTSAEAGEIVMKHLAKLDQVAYIRFASVYREFDDADDFIRAISVFVDTESVKPRHDED
ncbi:transcriptional regulator NrdR [Rubripirellula amarantea]|uniref:Transcriptional repressor NrdR n=1 Tax=Rubripirellula amarantea TaxID=2527999 RepID=A0A5C5WQK3_9BACT|nr:transcriptional regulator NrdR [Rubripirellula amarantea]MDA8744697.1 transcriptional regulator NrdR [Rubripirellula amarantea]TWT52740.1 Transcriptional repressor NrdR [Rubripirellula amarantea]